MCYLPPGDGRTGHIQQPNRKLRTTKAQKAAQKRAKCALQPGVAQSTRRLESKRPGFESQTNTA